jgi:hypothetical protein
MGEYWLLDRHGADGPTALVETDGSMHIVNVLRFGPSLTGLEEQQKIWDEVIGAVAPTLKPIVTASKLDEEGVELHADLKTDDAGGSLKRTRGNGGRDGAKAGRGAGGAKRTGGRGRG